MCACGRKQLRCSGGSHQSATQAKQIMPSRFGPIQEHLGHMGRCRGMKTLHCASCAHARCPCRTGGSEQGKKTKKQGSAVRAGFCGQVICPLVPLAWLLFGGCTAACAQPWRLSHGVRTRTGLYYVSSQQPTHAQKVSNKWAALGDNCLANDHALRYSSAHARIC